jgi:hypothetical protein
MSENTLFVDLLFNKSKMKPLNNSCKTEKSTREESLSNDKQYIDMKHIKHQIFEEKNDAVNELRKNINECESNIKDMNDHLALLNEQLREMTDNKCKYE